MVPAAAVIPAPIAYIKIVAKKARSWISGSAHLARLGLRGCVPVCAIHPSSEQFCPSLGWSCLTRSFTLKKLECLKQACAMNTLAWNNNLGLWSYFVGF